MVSIPAPSVVAMNRGSRLWTSSDDASISSDTSPRIQIWRGTAAANQALAVAG